MTELEKELEFLRYFYDAVDSALGPASSDIYDMIKTDFKDQHGYLPKDYEDEDE